MKPHTIGTTARQTLLALIAAILCCTNTSFATIKTATSSGNWGSGGNWYNSLLPSATDTVIIPTGITITLDCNQSIKSLSIGTGGTLNLSSGYTLTLSGSLTVNGTLDMNGGNITQNYNTAAFVIGSTGYFEWEPGTNTVTGATLFSRSVENFALTSTLNIKTWYDYVNVPLGNVVSGYFGNLIMNSKTGITIYEWNQNNQFQTHSILGTLTIDQGWITLDKSGAISNTSIGNIVLLSVNSSLYLHRGTHNSSFTFNTNSINITGGTFIALHDGNGDVTVNVGGNVTTNGNFKLINNDGVLNVGNGNGTLNITGTYTQTAGDTRLIYNISTINSGYFIFTVGTIQFNGGIFMGQYGCNSTGLTATVSVTNNLNLNFSASGDIFRFNGLTSLSGNMNTLKLNFSVGGNFSITAGSNGSEFTSAAAAGLETININGNMSVGGGKISFNYGFPTAAHDVVFNLGGNLTVSGGVFNLSKHIGDGNYTINGNVSISGNGTLNCKSDDGGITINVNGSYTQSGGTFYLHNNNQRVSSVPVHVTINGIFTHSGGTINFDDNSSNITETHELIIKGPSYNLTGNGLMTHAGAGTCTVFGLIRFERNGTITFNRSASGHSIQQVKQVVSDGTTLDVMVGNVQLSSHNTAALDFMTVQGGSTLKLRAGQVYSNATYPNSGITAEKDATISTMNLFGFYDGTSFTAVKSTGNMNFYLDENSTVEYNGWSNQIITGTGLGIATTNDHKYGILKINFNGTTDVNYLYPTNTNVFVRTALVLTKGELKLNGYPVTLENGAGSAVSRSIGYVKSESSIPNSNSFIVWQNMTTGSHEFPFGKSSTVYIPVIFSPISGMGGTVTIGTRATGIDNEPRPYVSTVNLTAISLSSSEEQIAENNYIDRWWDIEAPGFTASFTLSYPGDENTILTQYRTGEFNFEEYHDGTWLIHEVAGNGITAGIGTFTMNYASTFSSWVITARGPSSLPVSLLDFTAKPAANAVVLSWATAMEVNNDYFTLEKSSDGINFSHLAKVDGAGNSVSVKTYKHTDNDVEEGVIYYRLSQTDFDGTTVKHKIVSVNLGNVYFPNVLSMESVFPNPFNDMFTVTFSSTRNTKVEVTLTDLDSKLIHSESFMSEKGSNSYKYQNSSNIPNGIYFINITASGKTITKKIIKG
ncbi:MAG TPA: T9SS type A sorting domain-containing protein [Bacteroidia bacterium]|nr:T9SS type A sorting domain-containing protein [Bacteroidia bacterium]